ncbi:soluble lytic murein transglycosylase-like protein [Acetoanaerobium pronyense]|uniref:Soluble lytic murein transglycosylase-like protein n=1 Tax=Acetoanaerobium pronyense TaxID=1482736 RepID=A0ABS4KHV0_9FIRM|nr:lytic transglycosylase domain-containing protein [Acetoanaerobium pronyense]MBP2027370.1 soluble lytic murein transglycosylase-like protein [Acetoanaerobium pronyense]
MRKLVIVFAFLMMFASSPAVAFAQDGESTSDALETFLEIRSSIFNNSESSDPSETLNIYYQSYQMLLSPEVPEEVIEEKKVPASSNDSKETDALKAFIASKNSKLNNTAIDNIMKSVSRTSSTYGVDKDLIVAVMWVESTFNPQTIYNNCYGIMQIHANTGRANGLSTSDLLNSDKNIEFGVSYLARHINSYGGDVRKALSAYNQGTTRVNKGNYSKKYENLVYGRLNTIKEFVKNY